MSSAREGSPLRVVIVIATLLTVLTVDATGAFAAAKAPVIRVLSGRPDLVSGGDTLVGITLPKHARHLRVFAGHRNVTKAFAPVAARRVQGLVTGLKLGRTNLTATLRHGRGARLKIVNHPSGGPLFSGPQIQPWKCQAAAVDAKCDQPPVYSYLYKSAAATRLTVYDPDNPPGDVATTTTETGQTVPFIVRQETGYLDRDQYKIFTLFDPAEPWSAQAPQSTFNHKLFIPHGGGCGSDHKAAEAPTNDFSGTVPETPGVVQSYVDALGKGFVVGTTALDNLGHNCNVALQAEGLIMTKERVIEQYGTLKYTIGSGCSGGSITQQTVANAYPGGVYDGLIITCAYPDVMSALAQFEDYHLLRHYFENPAHLLGWTPLQWGNVEGRPDPVNAITADELFAKSIPNPALPCVADDQVYDAGSRPGGVRCGVVDFFRNLLGPRPKAVWSASERAAGRGFTGIPFGNTGVQYGLTALQQGQISAEQFVDLNAGIGGQNVDFAEVPERTAGDERAVANAYRTGLVNEESNMSGVAIIHHAGPDPGAAHDYAHSVWIRDRLDRSQGNHDNHVLWFGPAPLFGDINWPHEALSGMNRWLSAVTADHSRRPRAQKIVADKPADLVDRCPADLCHGELATAFGTPREVAGGDKYNDNLKCRLKPLARSDDGVTFTDDQWARLQAAFPTGVCDYSKPGVGHSLTIPWLKYGTRAGKVIYGGKPMRKPPRSHPLRRRTT
jgi:hypothetical protein